MNIKGSGIGLVFGWMLSSLVVCLGHSRASDSVNYDTAWTYVYDGGKTTAGKTMQDKFNDIKILPNGDALCVGQTQDSTYFSNAFVVKLSSSGNAIQKKMYRFPSETGATSLLITRNGNYVVGGKRYGSPILLFLDSALTLKSATWYYDSVSDRHILSRSGGINSMFEAGDGRIITTAGDEFPNNNNQALNNYAAYIEFDSQGAEILWNEFVNTTGYEIAGWSIAPSQTGGGVLMGGKQSLFKIDTTANLVYKRQYSFSLPGVGTEVNNISRIHRLRSGPMMVVGQTYEEDCWTRYNRLSYDAWWATLSGSGTDDARYTAGVSGQNDILYDFTQLVSGNIAFVGRKQSLDQMGGVWSFVTDSTGKTILWEKQIRIPFNGDDGSALTPYSVAATPDSGFTVVGQDLLTDSLGGANAFAAHFVPKSVPASNRLRKQNLIHTKILNHAWTFSLETPQAADMELQLFTVQGKLAGRYTRHMAQAGQAEISIAPSQLKNGIYLWQLRAGKETDEGIIALTEEIK